MLFAEGTQTRWGKSLLKLKSHLGATFPTLEREGYRHRLWNHTAGGLDFGPDTSSLFVSWCKLMSQFPSLYSVGDDSASAGGLSWW